jgi:hypothetical protein
MRGRQVGTMTVLLVMLCGALGALAGCGGASSASMSASSAAGSGAAVAGDALGAAGAPSLSPSKAAGKPPSAAEISALGQPVQLPTAVIKTADTSVRVAGGHLRGAVMRADEIAGDAGGYVTQSSVSGGRSPDALVVIRVPAARFATTLAALEKLGRERSQTITGQDVTQEYVNLNARLVNLRAQQQVMRRLMARAQTIAQSIEVQNQLSQVELQIEELTGQLLYLRNRTALSTITLRLTEAVPPPPAASHPNALWKAGARSLDGGLAVVTAIIVGAGFVIPLALIAAVLVLAGRKFLPGMRRALPDPEP